MASFDHRLSVLRTELHSAMAGVQDIPVVPKPEARGVEVIVLFERGAERAGPWASVFVAEQELTTDDFLAFAETVRRCLESLITQVWGRPEQPAAPSVPAATGSTPVRPKVDLRDLQAQVDPSVEQVAPSRAHADKVSAIAADAVAAVRHAAERAAPRQRSGPAPAVS